MLTSLLFSLSFALQLSLLAWMLLSWLLRFMLRLTFFFTVGGHWKWRCQWHHVTKFRWKHPWQQSGKIAEGTVYILEHVSKPWMNTKSQYQTFILKTLWEVSLHQWLGIHSNYNLRQHWLLMAGVGKYNGCFLTWTPHSHQVELTNLKPRATWLVIVNTRKVVINTNYY